MTRRSCAFSLQTSISSMRTSSCMKWQKLHDAPFGHPSGVWHSLHGRHWPLQWFFEPRDMSTPLLNSLGWFLEGTGCRLCERRVGFRKPLFSGLGAPALRPGIINPGGGGGGNGGMASCASSLQGRNLMACGHCTGAAGAAGSRPSTALRRWWRPPWLAAAERYSPSQGAGGAEGGAAPGAPRRWPGHGSKGAAIATSTGGAV
mmetsp:Transcript_100933/g.261269  ORF Transcript_100933/g.261269 Transcript_100933/m.261269 type:complete len:203 (-) Transcript_100933:303-911(-)